MKKELTELVFILDRSGSMQSMASEAIRGFNAFLEEQKKLPGEVLLTLVLFDHEYQLIHNGKNIHAVENLDDNTYFPRGMTALLDSIGRTVDDVGKRLVGTPEEERPSKILIIILTDGMENASKDYTRSKINKMITHQKKKYSWEFLFLAANQDAISEGCSIGISGNCCSNYASTGVGLSGCFGSINCATTSYRTSNNINFGINNGNKGENK